MRTALLFGLCVLGCALEPGGDASSLSGLPGGGQGSADDDGGDASSAGGTEGGETEGGGDEVTSGAADEASDGVDEGAADTSGAGADSSTGAGVDDGGNPGPACAGAGDLSMPGGGGAVPANQNCPQQDFTVQVADSPSAIADVDVSIDAVAANTSQNRVWLIAPDQTQVLLFDQRGTFLTDDFVGTEFDDQAPTLVATAPGPFHGCFAPEQGLAALNGKPADGLWTLRVETCLYETSVTGWQLHLDFE